MTFRPTPITPTQYAASARYALIALALVHCTPATPSEPLGDAAPDASQDSRAMRDVLPMASDAPDAFDGGDAALITDGFGANQDVRVSPLPEAGVPLPTVATLTGAPSAARTSLDVREYFPQPRVGQTIITEFAYTAMMNGVPTAVPYSVQRYERSPDGAYFFLEDFRITNDGHGGLEWLDTWVYTVDARGVLEVYDSAPTWTYRQFEHPLNHGLMLTKNVAFTSTSFEDGTDGTHDLNDYWIMLQDIKSTLTLPAGTFTNVAMQAESQLKCTTRENCAHMPRVIDEASSVRYRFYFAPGRGIIAQEYFDANWQPAPMSLLLYAVRSCEATTRDYVCPAR